jgi:SSS family solute:Na+ symporter
MTKPRPVSELQGLVMGATVMPAKEKGRWYQEPVFWGSVVAVVFVILNIALW